MLPSHRESKVHVVPGVPVLLTGVGRDYHAFTEQWLAEHPFSAVNYKVSDIAPAFWSDLRAHHKLAADHWLTQGGFDPDAELLSDAQRALGGQDMLCIGLQAGYHRPMPAVWHAAYPDTFPMPLHIYKDDRGLPIGGQCSGITACGVVPDSIKAVVENPEGLERLGASELVAFCMKVCSMIEDTDEGRDFRIQPPYDIVTIDGDGLEWKQRAEVAA